MTNHKLHSVDVPNPQMVTLARLSRELTHIELAAKLGMQQGALSKLEDGASLISSDDVSALSVSLGYPEPFFYQSNAFEGPGLVELYHSRKRKPASTALLNRAYAMAAIKRMHVETLLRSYDISDRPGIPILPASEYGDAERVARTVRAQLNVPPGPIFSMTTLVESAGGVVVPCDFGSHFIDGFTRMRNASLPALFFMNRDLPSDRWRWTLAHELGHAVMHSGLNPSETAEDEADTFAQELLMPRQLAKGHLLNVTFPKLAGLKLYWKVSIQALIMRAHRLKLISDRQRTYMFTQWTRAGYRIREPDELDPPRNHQRS